ncbi:MAG: PEP-CTERM sorting domain-containing protein [Bryobacteraceae bacterium]|nr:PEP-CTERM sorting domain-containing protein [Bryobacteraceae bacterium]
MLTGSFTSTFFSAGAQQSNITVTGVSGEVPEPMTVSLMGAGLLGLGLLRRRTAK